MTRAELEEIKNELKSKLLFLEQHGAALIDSPFRTQLGPRPIFQFLRLDGTVITDATWPEPSA